MESKNGLINLLDAGSTGFMGDLVLTDEASGIGSKGCNNGQQEMVQGMAPQSQQMWNFSSQHGLPVGTRYPAPCGGTPSKQVNDGSNVQMGTRLIGHYGQFGNAGNMGQSAASAGQSMTGNVAYGYQGMSPRMSNQGMTMVQGGNSVLWGNQSPGSDKSSSSFTSLTNSSSDVGLRASGPGNMGKYVAPVTQYLMQQSSLTKNYHAQQQQQQQQQLGSPPSNVSQLVPGSPHAGSRVLGAVQIPYSQGAFNISTFQNAETVQQGQNIVQQLNNGQYQFMACSPGVASNPNVQQGMMGNIQVYGQQAVGNNNYSMGYPNTVQVLSPGSSGHAGKQNILPLTTQGGIRMNPSSQGGSAANPTSAQPSGSFWHGMSQRQLVYQNGAVDPTMSSQLQLQGMSGGGGFGSGGMVPGQSLLISAAGGQYTAVTPLYQGAMTQHSVNSVAADMGQQHHGYGMQQTQAASVAQQPQHQIQQQQQQHVQLQLQMQPHQTQQQHHLQQHQLQQHHQVQHHQQMQQQHQVPQQHQIQQLQQNQLQQQQQQLHMQQLQMHQLQQQPQLQQQHQLQQHQLQLQQQGQQLLSSPPGQQHQLLQAQQLQIQHQVHQHQVQQGQQHQVQQGQQHPVQQGQQHQVQQGQQVYFAQKPISTDGTQLSQSLVILQPSTQPQQQPQVPSVSVQPGNAIQPNNLLQMGEQSKMILSQNATVFVYNGSDSNADQNSQMCFSNLTFQLNQSAGDDATPTAPLLHLPELKPALVSTSSSAALPLMVAENEPLSTPPPPVLTDTEDGLPYSHPYAEQLKIEAGFIQQHTSLYDFPADLPESTPEVVKKKRKRKPVALNEDGTPVKRKRKKKEVKEEVEDKPSSSFEPSSTLELGSTIEPTSTLEPISSFQSEISAELPEKKPKKAKKKPKSTKDPDAPKTPKTPKRPRTPKEGQSDEAGTSKKSKSSRARKRKSAALANEVNEVTSTVEMLEAIEGSAVEHYDGETPVKEKPKPPPRPKSKKKRPLPTFLKSKNSKVSRSDNSDVEQAPLASPVDDNSQNRRSSRFTKRHRYLDDLDLNLSDEENQSAAVEVDSSVVVKPVQFFVDNPLEEDAQIVEKILAIRIGKRCLNPPATVVHDPTTATTRDAVKEDGATENNSAAGQSSEQRDDTDDPCSLPTDTLEVKVEDSSGLNQKLPDPETSSQTQVESPKKPEDVPESKEVSQAVGSGEEAAEQIEVEEFFVKYKNFSYLHCEWRTADELEWGDKRVQQKIKRHKLKMKQSPFYQSPVDDEDLFNPDYVEVDRILDMSTSRDPQTGEELTHYLVKWRALAYEDSTWELALDVDKLKIEVFLQFRESPSESEREYKARPSAKEWESLEKCPQYKNDNTLREYQLEGLNWLSFCYFNKQNCILADEMGLGKTIQSISFVEQVFRNGIRGPFLTIVPLSTIGNWQREFEAWTDLNVIVYHGSTQSRNMIQEYEMHFKDAKGKRIPNVCRFHVLITTYEVIISDLELLRQIDWRVAIIDEAHRLKNRNCKLLQVLNCYDVDHRVLLTGTPLQNNVEELFSLLSFLEPKQFASPEAFLAEFGKLESEAQVDKLKALLKPMMLRRLKEDVEKSLAPKEETIIEVELTNIQKKYYRAILERNFSFLAKGGTPANVPNLMNTMMQLRKCCNHPYLINGAEEQILEEFHVGKQRDAEKMFQTMVHSSGKLVLTDKLLPKLKADGHKVLVFSQMIRVLDIIEDYLVYKKYPFERIDGRIRGNLRQEAIDRFSKPDSDRFVFLLCTRAGGLGINLTAADTVIIYDSDWNPQNDLQAQARCHRIGQQKSVKVYRLITRNSYEREMFDRASVKLGLDKAVLQSMGPKDITTGQLSKKEIEDLLKKGAYGALMEDDGAGTDFCEEDIEHILQRRTQVVQIEAGVKGSTFAKASFSLSTNRNDIDIDDPQFWQKWAKKADLDAEELLQSKENLILELPRQRRQVHRYGKQDATVNLSDLDTSGTEDEDDDGGGGGGVGDGGGEGKGMGSKSRRKRRGRHNHDEADTLCSFSASSKYSRSDCFNVERGLLVYGWGRWSDILRFEPFKRKLEIDDMKTISRAMLFYCLQNYEGDERIKMFIYDLVSPEDGQERSYKNHSGLSAPVPRGRKGRKGGKKLDHVSKKSPTVGDLAKIDIDPERILMDSNYKKHLKRHSNKILLRVRLLYYLKQEIIGDQADKVLNGSAASDVVMPIPPMDGEFPVLWWNREADKCLLIGVFKHGYEKYGLIRQDPGLCFLSSCGPPDGAALLMEQDTEEDIREENDDEDQDSQSKPKKDVIDDLDDRPPPDPDKVDVLMDVIPPAESGTFPFPSVADLNARLRRLITAFQKSHKRELLRQEQIEKRLQRREQCDIILKEKEQARMAAQQKYVSQSHLKSVFLPLHPHNTAHRSPASLPNNARWSRREEADFYRVVSTFGIERDPTSGEIQWENFRNMAHLDKKYDDSLLEYFRAFYHMCLSVCRRIPADGSVLPPAAITVEQITEERANRCLARIDLLCKIREQILTHPRLEEHLALCQPTPELPEWWKCGVHDKELLVGAARHGLSKTEFHILGDPLLSFSQHVPKSELESHGHTDEINQVSEKFSIKTPANLSANELKLENSVEDKIVDLKSKADEDNSVKVERLCQTYDVKPDVKDELVKEEKVEKVSEMEIIDNAGIKEGEKIFGDGLDSGAMQCSDSAPGEDKRMNLSGDNITADEDKAPGVEDGADKEFPLQGMVSDAETDTAAKSQDQSKSVVPTDDILDDGVLNLAAVKRAVHSDEAVSKQEVTAVTSDSGVLDSKGVKAMDETEETGVPQIKTASGSEQMERSRSPCADSPLGEDASSLVDNTLEGLGLLFSSSQNQWPKDRVIFHRLENICLCVEKGEWPVNRRYFVPSHVIQGDSHSSTPIPETPATGSSTPVLSADKNVPISSDRLVEGITLGFQKRRHRRTKAEMEADRVARLRGLLVASRVSRADRDLESLGLQGAALIQKMMDDRAAAAAAVVGDDDSATSSNEVIRKPLDWVHTFKKRRRGRRSKVDQLLELQALEAFEQHTMLGNAWHSAGIDFRQQVSVPTTTPEKQQQVFSKEKPAANQSSKRNDEPERLVSLVSEKKKPERDAERKKSLNNSSVKAESPAAAQKKQTHQISEDEESGLAHFACTSSDQLKERMLQNFLSQACRAAEDHGTLEDKIQSELSQVIGLRQRRRPRLDPTKMEIAEVTGDENVSVIDRANGKRITGAKAPPLRYLKDWLLSNPAYDIDPKWAHIVKAKGNLPAELHSRILRPSGRGRRSGASSALGLAQPSAPSAMDFLSKMTNLQAMASGAGAAGLMGFPNLPFPGLSLGSLGLANPMLAAASYASLGLLPGLGKLDLDRDESNSNEKDDKDKTNAAEKSSGKEEMDLGLSLLSGIHPSFPFSVYAPMLMNPFFAQNLAAATTGFSLQGSFPGLGALPMSSLRTVESNPEEGRAETKPASRRHKSSASASSAMASAAQAEPEDLSTQAVTKARGSSHKTEVALGRPSGTRTAAEDEGLVKDLSVERKSTSIHTDVAKLSAPAQSVSASQGTSSMPVATVAVSIATVAAPPVRSQPRRSKTGLLDSISNKLMAQKMGSENKRSELTDTVSADDDKPLTSSS